MPCNASAVVMRPFPCPVCHYVTKLSDANSWGKILSCPQCASQIADNRHIGPSQTLGLSFAERKLRNKVKKRIRFIRKLQQRDGYGASAPAPPAPTPDNGSAPPFRIKLEFLERGGAQ